MTLLNSLNAYDNDLSGTLPAEYSSLPKLADINLERNNIGGTLPPQWSQLGTVITSLNLHNNAIGGTLPGTYTALTKITSFSITNNALSGVNVQTSGFSHLSSLSLAGNAISLLPPEWSVLTGLSYL